MGKLVKFGLQPLNIREGASGPIGAYNKIIGGKIGDFTFLGRGDQAIDPNLKATSSSRQGRFHTFFFGMTFRGKGSDDI